MQTADQLLTVDEAARILTLRPATVRALAHAGRLPTVRPAATRAVRFRLSDIQPLAGLQPAGAAKAEALHGVDAGGRPATAAPRTAAARAQEPGAASQPARW